MSSIGLGIAGAGLAYGVVNSAIQQGKANKIKKGLVDPTYNIPQEFYQNREIARQMAEQGLPSQQYNNAANNINQSQATSLASAQNSSNPSGAIAGITGQTNQAKANLDATDAAARQNNERFFINENAQLGNQKLQKQQNDVYDKFTRDFNQYQAYQGAAQQGLNNTISGAQQLGQAYLKSQSDTSPGLATPTSGQTWGQANNVDPITQLPITPNYNYNATPWAGVPIGGNG